MARYLPAQGDGGKGWWTRQLWIDSPSPRNTLYYKMEEIMVKPELSNPITLRLPVDVLQRIEEIARATDRTRSWVMVRALKQYLAREGKDILAAVEGRRQIAAGQVHDMDEVLDELDAITKDDAA
jgi:predicted transcriptional regulator